MHDQELPESIRSQVRSGRLPSSSTRHTLFGGKGEGGPCACCGRLITAAQIQFEVDFADAVILQMHPSCHDEWIEASIALATCGVTLVNRPAAVG
jgi:hypothetical protein